MFAVDEIRLLSGKPFDIGVGITLYQPTMTEIANFGENEYLSLVSALTSEPFDMPYYLDQMGIDFEKIKPFELFCILVSGITKETSRLLFGDLDFSKFRPIEKDGELVLVNSGGIIIDSLTRERIADNVRRMHCLPKNILTSCENKFTHDLMIRQQKKNIDRAQRRKDLLGDNSQYAPLISSLACEWHDYDRVFNLRVGQFFDAIIRMGYRQSANNLYRGLYSGTVSFKDIHKTDLDWMRPIKTKNL
jgi:hypothetical protein